MGNHGGVAVILLSSLLRPLLLAPWCRPSGFLEGSVLQRQSLELELCNHCSSSAHASDDCWRMTMSVNSV
ncbi:hypothetical protein J5N97_013672 [Dioscorea zingiberensis]|uniref:Secreted protein n=1 Tax=Dioscorea zingiberensis TaxID=325984 RepID=A0A9D5HJ06_9LILI|nr:hypothetical protein J5N97_013672 [Dioscorea zingiberensis]